MEELEEFQEIEERMGLIAFWAGVAMYSGLLLLSILGLIAHLIRLLTVHSVP